MTVILKSSLDTISNAATCEYLHDGSLICGTYQLIEDNGSTAEQQQPGKRVGNLLLLVPTEDGKVATVRQTVTVPGVLDIKPRLLPGLTAALLADGSVKFFSYDKDTESDTIFLVENQSITVTDGLCLAGAWSETDLAVSDSCGGVSILTPTEAGYCIAEPNWSSLHGFEVWSVCWDYGSNHVLYTGGDDSLLKISDLRSGSTVTVRGHDAGVTSIVASSLSQNSILTGSYDENIRCWDKRLLSRPVHALQLGGGVWRLKACPGDARVLACACMQGGARIVTFSESEGFAVLESFMHNRQLVYGIDWKPSVFSSPENHDQQSIIAQLAACSFYDHVLDLFDFSTKPLA